MPGITDHGSRHESAKITGFMNQIMSRYFDVSNANICSGCRKYPCSGAWRSRMASWSRMRWARRRTCTTPRAWPCASTAARTASCGLRWRRLPAALLPARLWRQQRQVRAVLRRRDPRTSHSSTVHRRLPARRPARRDGRNTGGLRLERWAGGAPELHAAALRLR